MNEDVKEMWKAALTSGEYEQGLGSLKVVAADKTKYCCLGVLCDLYQKETGKGHWDDDYFVDDSGDRSSGFLPNDVRSWAGLTNNCPEANGHYLHSLNDTGTPFVRIAEHLDDVR